MLKGGPIAPAKPYWILPGGIVYRFGDDRRIYRQDYRPWPEHTQSGDAWVVDRKHVRMHYQVNLGAGTGGIVQSAATFGGDVTKPEGVGSYGQYHAWSTPNVSVSIDQLNITPGFGYTRPNFNLTGGSASYTTDPTADWGWTQQTNQAPEQGLGTFKATLQRDYLAGMTYLWGACAARNLAVILQPKTSDGQEGNGAGPNGRPWLGWSMDSQGVARRIPDLSDAYVRKLGHDNKFVPEDKDTVTSSGMSWGWQFLRPLGPLTDDTVLATGCILYSETYTRVPDDGERPYMQVGRSGYRDPGNPNPKRYSIPMTDAPVNWIYYREPQVYDTSNHVYDAITIQETRNTFLFVKVAIGRAGIVDLVVTGQSLSRSTQVYAARSGYYNNVSAIVMRRAGNGAYDVYWQIIYGGNGYAGNYPGIGYDGGTFDTRFYTSPNGWRMAVEMPQINGVDTSAYMPIMVYADSPLGNAQPPQRPQGWDDATMGPWQVPPNDIPYGMFWRGCAFYDPDTGETHYQQANNYYTYENAADIIANGGAHPLYPNGPYPRTGAGQWYGKGVFTLASHWLNGRRVETSKAAGGIVPASNGPGGTYNAYCAPDATRPAMQIYQWPGRAVMLARFQSGAWMVSYNGGTNWTAAEDLGMLMGTLSVGHGFVPPDPEDA